MLEPLLIEYVWLAVVIWGVIYVSDYYLTLYAAHLYHRRGKEYIVFEGSIELTPYFQNDIDRLRLVSRRFLGMLLLSCVGIVMVWWLSVQYFHVPDFFSFLMGALILQEAALHIRHARNIVLFKAAQSNTVLRGTLAYPRWLTLKLSCIEFLSFAGLFFLVFLVSGSMFCLGGTVSCVVTSQKRHAWAQKARANRQAAQV